MSSSDKRFLLKITLSLQIARWIIKAKRFLWARKGKKTWSWTEINIDEWWNKKIKILHIEVRKLNQLAKGG